MALFMGGTAALGPTKAKCRSPCAIWMKASLSGPECQLPLDSGDPVMVDRLSIVLFPLEAVHPQFCDPGLVFMSLQVLHVSVIEDFVSSLSASKAGEW